MCRKGFVLFCLLLSFTFTYAQKTVNTTAKNNQYVIHRVKFGETLTKIANKYDVKIQDILKVNPSLTENSIMPEQIIRIPNQKNKKLITDSKTEDSDLKPNLSDKPKLQPKNGKLHTVEKGQTLYGISKLYGVQAEELKKWNHLPDNNVKIGSQLLVYNPENKEIKKQANPEPIKEIEKASEPVKNQSPVQTAITTPDESVPATEEIEKPDVQASNNENQKELAALFKKSGAAASSRGTGAPMTTTLGAMENVYFAMHKTLPIGTIIKIKNLVNSKVVYAKVIGKLPETDENKHVIVRYSLGVKKDLQLQNGKCYVQITFPD